MPSEQPNENMDEVLKAYAKKRREDSSQIEMDLPTRNMLQAEVKRTLAEVPVPAATKPRPRFAWWPRLIIGVASAAALAIAVLVWKLPSRTETSESAAIPQPAPAAETYAAKEQPQPTEPSKDAAPALKQEERAQAPATASDIAQQPQQHEVQADKKAEPTATAEVANAAPTTPAPAPETSSSVAASAPASVAAPTPATTPEPAIASKAAPAASIAATAPAWQDSTRSLSKSDSLDRHINIAPRKQSIRFMQINNRTQYRVNLNSPPLPKVLTKFGLERTGTNIVIKDADGSVYSGKAFQNAPVQNHAQAFAFGAVANSTNSAAQNTNNVITDDNFAFHVSGYNRKLRQRITFTGNVSNAAQNAPVGVNTFDDQQDKLQSSNAQQQLPAQNILLNGRVQVGRNSEFTIEAAPVTK